MAAKKAVKKSEAIQLQELANKSAQQIQNMINSANKLTQTFNAKEAEKARKYNTTEAATARKFNEQQAKIERDFNAAEAQKARDWQTQMSNTAHQREVADLRKAGLNPVLSANSGAQSYTTASANAGAASSGAASAGAASGSFDSGAGAMSSILGGLMSSITGLKQSQMSASAQLQSSRISAEASRYASDIARQNALTSAQAQRYAADMAYKTQMDKPQNSITGLLDKHFGRNLNNGSATKFYNKVKSTINSWDKSNVNNLKRGTFTLSNKRGNLDDVNIFLRKNFNVNINRLSSKDRRSAARAVYDLQYSKTAPGALNTLARLKSK